MPFLFPSTLVLRGLVPVKDPVAVGTQRDALLHLTHRGLVLPTTDQGPDGLLLRPIDMVEVDHRRMAHATVRTGLRRLEVQPLLFQQPISSPDPALGQGFVLLVPLRAFLGGIGFSFLRVLVGHLRGLGELLGPVE